MPELRERRDAVTSKEYHPRMRPVRVVSYPRGPRVWVLDQRVHHGATGLLLAAACLRGKRRPLALLGLALAAHDRRDWRIWFRREKCDGSHTTRLDIEITRP
jgi:hypothetical protein